MKKLIIIVALIFIELGVTAQEIVRDGIMPKIEAGMGYSSYGPLTIAGFGANYKDFSLTTGIILISQVKVLDIHQIEYTGAYIKTDINILSMVQKNLESRMQFRLNILLAYGSKKNTIDGVFEKERSVIVSPGIMAVYKLRKVDLALLVQYLGLKANNKHNGQVYLGLMISVFI